MSVILIKSTSVWVAAALALLLVTSCTTDSDNAPLSVTENLEGSTVVERSDVRLVTIAGNDAGWLIIDNESGWISIECRRSIEARGGSFGVVPWSEIEATSATTASRSCDDVSALYFAGESETLNSNADNSANSAPIALRRGINLAGDLEVEPRGSWGTPIDPDSFARIAAAGFDHVRLPVRWSAYTGTAPAYGIDEAFFLEVDRMVELANEANLGLVVNVHFFEELEADPAGEQDRFIAIWDQIARRYQNEPSSVVFELLNEPIGEFVDNPELWNALAAEALAAVRQTNPDRSVIIGPVQYNHPSRLADLNLPADNNVVATIHTYDPIEFTHQGAVFIDPVPATAVLWRADLATIDLEWEDRSWDTNLSTSSAGLQADYQRQFSAIAMRTDEARPYQQMVIEVDQVFDAVVVCNFLTPPATDIAISFAGTRGTADISSCGAVSSLAVQLVGEDPLSVTFSRLGLCADGCDEVIVSQYQALDKQVSTAAAWAAGRGVSLYLGEFGTLDPVGDPTDPQSRADWTRSMRTIAESYGLGWAYFAHDDEFGAYDRAEGQWVPGILDALMD